jgi:hypothetical protein
VNLCTNTTISVWTWFGNYWRRGWESNPRIVVLQTTALGHLATAPLFVMPKFYAQFYAQRAFLTPIYPYFCVRKLLKPRSGWL